MQAAIYRIRLYHIVSYMHFPQELAIYLSIYVSIAISIYLFTYKLYIYIYAKILLSQMHNRHNYKPSP